jgi:uncharacterized membrane protein
MHVLNFPCFLSKQVTISPCAHLIIFLAFPYARVFSKFCNKCLFFLCVVCESIVLTFLTFTKRHERLLHTLSYFLTHILEGHHTSEAADKKLKSGRNLPKLLRIYLHASARLQYVSCNHYCAHTKGKTQGISYESICAQRETKNK